jgi:hypothetical protein
VAGVDVFDFDGFVRGEKYSPLRGAETVDALRETLVTSDENTSRSDFWRLGDDLDEWWRPRVSMRFQLRDGVEGVGGDEDSRELRAASEDECASGAPIAHQTSQTEEGAESNLHN